jgi:ABC-2 type transport system ATP-binding protein
MSTTESGVQSPGETDSKDPPAIRTEGLTKRFGDLLAVQDLDLTVGQGEIFGFLGPNGAGKSTTIDLLMDYVRPSAGSASVLGMDTRSASRAIRRRVGILPDGYGLYDRLTAREHLEYAVDLKGAEDEPAALLERVGLDTAAADRPAGGYSKGMGQRLALAIALVGDPDLLILDEPSSGLDPNGVRLVREIARDHAARGKSVFFSSHVLSQVEAVCDRVAILDGGRLVAQDTIAGLRETFDAGSTMTLVLDREPDETDLAAIQGVGTASANGRELTVRILAPEAKVRVVDRVREDGAEILDLTTAEASLEDLFAASTGGHSPVEDATEGTQ